MTLNKHKIQGLDKFRVSTLDSTRFEQIMQDAGYSIVGTAPAQGGRVKVWWSHSNYPRVESIYSADTTLVITAYHVS
jgi:hypothetical protein